MKEKVIVDTGPLVTFYNKTDHFHQWSITQFKQLTPPFHTCEAVLAEAFFLLRKIPPAHEALLKTLERNLIKIDFHLSKHVEFINKLIYRYKNIPMSLADACLVKMSETINNPIILTIDSDFKIYRRNGRQVIPAIMP